MKPISSSLCVLWLTLNLYTPLPVVFGGNLEFRSDFYEGHACYDFTMEHVLRAQTFQAENLKHNCIILCGQRCSASIINGNECDYFIFHQPTNTCRLVGSDVDSFTDRVPDFAMDPACTVGKRLENDDDDDDDDTISCQNGGVANNFTCSCDKDFTGRHCEIPNPSYCQSGKMEVINTSHYGVLSESNIPATAIFNSELIVPVKTSARIGSGPNCFVQAHDFLDLTISTNGMTDGFFTNPFHWRFILHPLSPGPTPYTATVRVDGGGVFGPSATSQTAKVFVPKYLDDSRLVFNDNGGGTTVGTDQDVIKELSSGHRKLERESVQVRFDQNSNEASFGNVLSRLKTHTTLTAGWVEEQLYDPLTYETFNESLSDDSRNFTDHLIGTPYITDFYTKPATKYWEMDRCWTQINPIADYEEFTSVLKEYIERGFEFRVIINGQISSDVIEIQATQNDVIAQLPGALSSGDTVYERSVISVTKTESLCVTEFQGPILSFDTRTLVSAVDWYVSTKPWVKIFSVNSQRDILYGNEADLHHVVKSLSKKIRVCIHYTKWDTFVVCHGSASMTVTTSFGILFQTQASFKLLYEEDIAELFGVFLGIYDADCRQYVKLVSSRGWIQEVPVVTGSVPLQFNFSYVADFVKVDWFTEDG